MGEQEIIEKINGKINELKDSLDSNPFINSQRKVSIILDAPLTSELLKKLSMNIEDKGYTILYDKRIPATLELCYAHKK